MDIKSKSSDMTKYSFIELNIDELVLSGFQLKDRNVIGKSVETELERLLTNNGHRNLFEKNISLDKLDVGNFPIKANSGTEEIGKQVANSIYKGIV